MNIKEPVILHFSEKNVTTKSGDSILNMDTEIRKYDMKL